MIYLITGRNGQLATEFLQRLERSGAQVVAPDESLLDITDADSVEGLVAQSRPAVILNCAAYNLVDNAERDRDAAFQVNAVGPKVLAEAAKKHGAMLVHFGSDYVFDGRKENGLYEEDDTPAPLNEYGRSKLAGEEAVREVLGSKALIFRLSWVFGQGKQNFIRKFLERAGSPDVLKVTCDEFSVPTWTGTVVDVVMQALDQGLNGLYHLTNSGYCSRYEWAKLILKTVGIVRFVRPVSMDSFSLPAHRPGFSAMSNLRIERALSISIPAWEDAVAAFLRQKGS
jgi:dTDP-4-dehydrorhamnose reductase